MSATDGEGGPRPATGIGRAFIEVLRRSVRQVRDNLGAYALLWGLGAAITLALYPYDRAVLTSVQNLGAPWYRWAGTLSELGKFENSSLLFAVILAIVGMVSGRVRWRRAAAACLIAGIVGGLAVTVLRPGLGRARPHAEVEPGFYFLEIDPDFHSMPSGHATANTASALAVLRVLPAAGVPIVVFTAVVSWSRMQLNRHYPTDILWGIVLGTTIGWAVGGAIAGERPADRSRTSGRS